MAQAPKLTIRLDEDVERFACRIVASVFGTDPDFGMFGPPPERPSPRLLSDDAVADITARARDVGLVTP